MSSPPRALRPTFAKIDLSALGHNLRIVRAATPKKKVYAIVKADAYGHGRRWIAERARSEGVDGFGVALAEEALDLRESGIPSPILILNGIVGDGHSEVVRAGLTPVIYEIEEAKRFHAAAQGRTFGVHLKIDTGMGRLGVAPVELDAFLESFGGLDSLRIEGVMTHLATSDDDPLYVAEQLGRFEAALDRIRQAGHRPQVLHVANSAAIFRHSESHYDAVRPGISLYGYSGIDAIDAELKPVLSWRTEIIRIWNLAAGESLGYGRTYRATEPRRVATLPVGYADGLLRASSNRSSVLIGGKRCPCLGRVSMDLSVVDISEVPDALVGDEAILIGEQGAERIGADEMAQWAGTISYEVLTNVSRRVPRVLGSD